MSLRLTNVVFDCADAMRAARFWSEALGRPLDDQSNEFFATIGRHDASQLTLFFARVPEAKAAKNRVHVDLSADDRQGEVERLLGLGAERVADVEEWGHKWTVLRDVEGNEFCVA